MRQIAFIDPSVESWKVLAAGINPGVEVYILDSNLDAITQITQALSDRPNTQAIHIVSHGAPGMMMLGKTIFNELSLEDYTESLQQWSSSGGQPLKVLLYGCRVMAGEIGRSFVAQLQDITGAIVAASRTLVGNQLDWRLLTTSGFLVSDLAFTDSARSLLSGTLSVSFAPQSTFTVGNSPSSVVTADFNGDNNLDLLVSNNTPNEVSLLLGDGDGGFSSQAIVFTAAPIVAFLFIAVGDFNKDNNLDFAVSQGTFISVLLGDGTGNFTPTGSVGIGLESVGIVAGDFDGDNNLDLAVANYSTNTTSVLLGDGSGGFGPQTDFSNALLGFASDIGLGDFNGDGILDLQISEYPTNIGSVLLGDGSGGFSATTAISATNSVSSTRRAIADFDGDGNLDSASVDFLGSVLVALGDDSGPIFSPTSLLLSVGVRPRAISAGDFDGDGDLDLAVANELSNNISVLLNTTPPRIPLPPDNDSLALVGFSDSNFLVEEDSDIGTVATLLRSGNINSIVSVVVSFGRSGTATVNEDYSNLELPLIVNFFPGEINKTITIPIIDDTEIESSETFELQLNNPVGTDIGIQTTTITIQDNESGFIPMPLSPCEDLVLPNIPVEETGRFLGMSNANRLFDFNRSNIIRGRQDNDLLFGFDEDDFFTGGQGSDWIRGGSGDDIAFGDSDDDFIFGELGNDLLFGDTAQGGLIGGNDLITGGDGDDTICGGHGNDVLLGQRGNDRIDGNSENDQIVGGPGNDLLLGGLGNDLLVGDAGDDTLLGNAGADTFLVGGGSDIILDFTQGEDQIALLSTIPFEQLTILSRGTSVLVLFSGDRLVMLQGITTLDASDFLS